MTGISRPRLFAVAAVAIGMLGIASAAQAHTDVQFSFGLGAPVYSAPGPVYVQPQATYVTPQPIYVQPQEQVYLQPRYSYEEQQDWQRRQWREQEWRREEWRRRQWQEHHDRGEHRGRDHREGRD
ncbi:hypothetical protein [Ramlibacter sp.]|uniref:hypothetical protein n=1 Tax=Ramlibacter sp. TaxID=1917967 RepID=UPI0026389954|nr:hypothetical protein [Ramlibacter sp.]MDB5956381.1 signal peptide protein [Ramlibacter sp.]